MADVWKIGGVVVPSEARVAVGHLRSVCRAVVAAGLDAGDVPYGIAVLRAAAPYVEVVATFVGNEGAGRIVEALAAEEATALGDVRFGLVQTGERNVARLGVELGHATGLRHRGMRVSAYQALDWVSSDSEPRLFSMEGLGKAVADVVRRDARARAGRAGRLGRESMQMPTGSLARSEPVSSRSTDAPIGGVPTREEAVVANVVDSGVTPEVGVPLPVAPPAGELAAQDPRQAVPASVLRSGSDFTEVDAGPTQAMPTAPATFVPIMAVPARNRRSYSS